MSWIDEDTEAAHLAEIEEDGWYDSEWEEEQEEEREERRKASRKRFLENREAGVNNDEYLYLKNKQAKVGETIVCAGPLCGKKIKKKQYAQAFCCNKCKDQFWNRREAHYGWKKPIVI